MNIIQLIKLVLKQKFNIVQIVFRLFTVLNAISIKIGLLFKINVFYALLQCFLIKLI